ncbi:MAG: class I SAM-dependent methyltransferase [Microbacteriaceae bacterium]
MAGNDWQRIAADYESGRASETSLDHLIEWPAQERVVGSVESLRVLDLGCGNGSKSIAFASSGAARVLGLDIVDAFADVPDGLDVTFRVGDLSEVRSIVGEERFDLVTIFQAIGYAQDERRLMHDLFEVIAPGGHLVIARSHPIRFAVERARAEAVPLGVAYRATEPFTYPASWGTGTVTHRTFTFSETLNPALEAGFELEHIDEPAPTDELRERSPKRAAWMDDHVGLIIYRFSRSTDEAVHSEGDGQAV